MSLVFWVLVWSVLLFSLSNLLPVDKTARRAAKEIAR
jgi:hypothetical protein